jgi:hypothetical protein
MDCLFLLFSIDKLYVLFIFCYACSWVVKCMKFPLQPKSIFLAIRCMVSLKAIAKYIVQTVQVLH